MRAGIGLFRLLSELPLRNCRVRVSQRIDRHDIERKQRGHPERVQDAKPCKEFGSRLERVRRDDIAHVALPMR